MSDKYGLGFSETEKKDYERVLGEIRRFLVSNDFTIEKEWYPDGYLISNDYKMWHLELKECPGWLFGVWLDDISDNENSDWYRLQVFAQHENYINKFKPTDCMVVKEYEIYKNDLKSYKVIPAFDLEQWVEIFSFVKEQPYLAWYRNQTYTDYNLTYVSPARAKREFIKSEKREQKIKKCQQALDKAEVAWMKKYLDNLGYKYKITTDGNAIPGHNVVIEDPTIEKKGFYSLMDDDNWADFRGIFMERKQKNKYIYSTFDNSALFVKEIK